MKWIYHFRGTFTDREIIAGWAILFGMALVTGFHWVGFAAGAVCAPLVVWMTRGVINADYDLKKIFRSGPRRFTLVPVVVGVVSDVVTVSHEFLNRKLIQYQGCKMGEGCQIYSRGFGSEPFMVELGKRVEVTAGVNFITHDGGAWVFWDKEKPFMAFGRIKVGDNTFLGNRATILPGVSIGNNCVVGAESVVTKSVRDGSVVAGNPARYICSIEEYRAKMGSLTFLRGEQNSVFDREAEIGSITATIRKDFIDGGPQ